jgi:N-acetyl-anhydromuramyl-L-alanine amidase AmpD
MSEQEELGLRDFTAMSAKDFWKLVDEEAGAAQTTVKEIFEKADRERLTQVDAIKGLDALYIDSHRRIKEHSKALAKVYPTKQLTQKKLMNVEDMWWVDHYTSGISRWSTLSWFSAKKTKRNGKMRFNGASTHFVLGYEGYPFYIIPLMHGAWHEPKRNKDSIGIEMVNCGAIKQKDGKFCYWPKDYTQEIPPQLVADLPPTRLPFNFRGAKILQPFTATQIKYNILLKRIILAALPGKIDKTRFSQHQEWRSTKLDMGPLWPFKDVNDAAHDAFPISQYSFLSKFALAVKDGTITEAEAIDLDMEDQNPAYGTETPTHEDDLDDDNEDIMSMKGVQEYLTRCGFRVTVDGKFGPKTKNAVAKFQTVYNMKHPSENALAVDGIPGPRTCAALRVYEKE